MNSSESRLTEDQRWEQFWDVVAPAIAQGIRDGRITQDDYRIPGAQARS